MTATPHPRPRDLRPGGPAVPARCLPVAAGVTAAALVLVQFPGLPLPVAAALALALGALLAVRADAVVSGALVLLLGAHQVWHYGFRESDGSSHLHLQPMGVHADFLVLLAGAHLLHVLTALAAAVPARGVLELAVLRRPALRLVAVQVPTQLAACAVLAAQGPRGGIGGLREPAVGLLGALALGGVVLAVARRHRR